MGLDKGALLGPCVIVALVGAGGMRDVYRARDERIGRDVAIKVLPPEFAADRERLRRFEHETRAAGALDHPRILTVNDLGRENPIHRSGVKGQACSPGRATVSEAASSAPSRCSHVASPRLEPCSDLQLLNVATRSPPC
jgi:serine/threonine protein kinase